MGFPHMVFLPYKPAKFEGSSSMGRGCAPNGGRRTFARSLVSLIPMTERGVNERTNSTVIVTMTTYILVIFLRRPVVKRKALLFALTS